MHPWEHGIKQLKVDLIDEAITAKPQSPTEAFPLTSRDKRVEFVSSPRDSPKHSSSDRQQRSRNSSRRLRLQMSAPARERATGPVGPSFVSPDWRKVEKKDNSRDIGELNRSGICHRLC